MIINTSLSCFSKPLLIFVFIISIGISLSAVMILTLDNTDPVDANPIDTESTEIIPTENTITPIMEQKIAQIQIPFIKNEGQADSQILYYAKIFSGQVAITSDDIVYDLNSDGTQFVIKESFGNLLHPQGMDKSETDINYFVGAKENWKSHVPAYQSMLVETPWYNIDAKVISHMSNTEKIFTVHPYGNPSEILISVDGPDTLSLSENNELVMHFGQKKTSFTAPVAYQMIKGDKVNVDVSYVIHDTAYGFSVGKYDTEYDLIIDPLLSSTFLGHSGTDHAYGIAINSSGAVYVTGKTVSSSFPTTIGAYDTIYNTNVDAFVSKFNSGLTSLEASTFLGGAASDIAYGIAINSSGSVYVAGKTAVHATTNLPVTSGAYDTSHDLSEDAFVSKFNSDLSSLDASTFLGGADTDYAYGIAINSGAVYVTGQTSGSFPTTIGAYDTVVAGTDIFVSKFNSDLSSLDASTYLGGSGASTETGYAIAINSAGVYVTGVTNSDSFPTTSGAYDRSYAGEDAFVSKFNSGLTSLEASTYLGGSKSGTEVVLAMVLDSSGNVYVAGYTSSDDFPTTSGAYDTLYAGSADAFVSKFNSGLTSLSESTFLGGSNTDIAYGIAIDSSGNVYVAGSTLYTTSTSFPTIAGAYDTSHNGDEDAFVSKFEYATTTTEIPHGSGCADCTPPTLGVDHNSKRLVANGFSYNTNPVDVSLYYTPYPLITANIGYNNTAEFKIYENSGPDNIRHFDFAFGLAKGQILSDSKARIEWDKNWDGTEDITLVDPNNVLQNVTISSKIISCQDTSNDKCLLLIVFHTFRAPLEFDIVATNVWDEHRNAWQNYYNHGIHITGESLNPPKQYTGIDKGHIYHLTETGKNTAVDEFGNGWSYDNTWIKNYIKNEKLQDPYVTIMARDHSNFNKLVDRETVRAEAKLLTLCPECSESFDTFTPSTTIPYSERINKLDDPEIQKKLALEADKAQKIMDALQDLHDRNDEN